MPLEPTTFELTEDHLALLGELEFGMIDWEWPGAPGADAKRPYGNSGHAAIKDFAEILGAEDPEDAKDPEDAQAQLLLIWNETGLALQVITQTRSFELGKYVRRKKGGGYAYSKWKKKS